MAAERGVCRDLAQLPARAGARGPRHGPPGATEDPRACILLRVHAHGDRREPRRATWHGEGADAARPEEAPGPLRGQGRGPGDGGDGVAIAYGPRLCLAGRSPRRYGGLGMLFTPLSGRGEPVEKVAVGSICGPNRAQNAQTTFGEIV